LTYLTVQVILLAVSDKKNRRGKMKVKIFSVLFLMAVMVIPAFAGYEMYLQIDQIAGSPSDTAHKDWIPVEEIVDNTIKTGNVATLVIVKLVEGNSAALYKSCLEGTTRNRALLDVCKDGVLSSRTILNSLNITQIKPELLRKNSDPREEITFSFRQINWEFNTLGTDGKPVTTRTGWDNVMKRAM
jgi:type VI protein secretion system component Hcp